MTFRKLGATVISAIFLLAAPPIAIAQMTEVTMYVLCLSDAARKLKRASPNMHEDAILDFAFQDCIPYEVKLQLWAKENTKENPRELLAKFKKGEREMLRLRMKKPDFL